MYLGKVSLKLQRTWVATSDGGGRAVYLQGTWSCSVLRLPRAPHFLLSSARLTDIFVPEGHLELFKSWSPLEVQLRSLSSSRSLS